ncbi:MAG: cation:proton antiporter [Gammaproteobacteria bacterium]|nr:cation:proton antiporter [Gammaproteobacteria bacterium]
MDVFIDLLALLILTRVLGEAAERLKQPASAGEILAGVLLALLALTYGDVIPFAVELVNSKILIYTADIGIFCLVFLAGIETEPKEIVKHFGESFFVAAGGIVVPLIGGFALAWLFLPESDHRQALALLTGIVMSITAVPATAKILQELQLTHTRLGQVIMGAALFDDVIGLFLLAILLALIDTGNIPNIMTFGLLVAKVFAFFAITILLGVHVYPRVSRGLNTMQATSLEFSALAVVGLAYGLLAESLGMHWILGAFMAGLFFERSRVGVRSYNEIKLIFTAVTRGMLAPLFFASIGLRFDPNALISIPFFLALLLMVAFVGKIVGCGIPALLVGLPRRDALAVGIGMSTRGAVGFVVLSIAYNAGLFEMADHTHPITTHLFSGLVLMAVITTMLAPALLHWLKPNR